MASKVLAELLRGAESRGIAVKDILDNYSIAITPAIFREVMCSVRKSETAVDFFHWAPTQPGFLHDTQTCNSLLRVVVDDRRPAEAYRLFTDVLLPLHCPSLASYNLLIRGYCEAGEVWKALRLLKEMKARDQCPDETTHVWILKGFSSNGRMIEAMEYFRSVVDTSGLDGSMYEALIDGFCKVDRLDEAFRLVEEMVLEIGWIPNGKISCLIIEKLCKAGELLKALKVFTHLIDRTIKDDAKEIEETKTKKNKGRTLFSVTKVTLAASNVLIRELCIAGRVDDALVRVFERCKEKDVVDAASYGVLIQALCKTGRMKQSLGLLEEMRSSRGFDPDAATYSGIVAGFCDLDMVEQAVEFFESVIRDRESAPDAVLVGTLADGLCRSGRALQAAELIEEMNRSGCRLSGQSHCLLIEELCKQGEVARACKILRESLRRGCAPANSATYTTIVEGLFASLESGAASREIKRILTSSISPGVMTCCAIIDGICKAGKFSESRWFLDSLKQSGIKPDIHIHNSLLAGYCKSAKIDEACKFFRDMVDENLSTAVTYNILLDGFCKVVRIEEACSIFVAMVNKDCLPTPVTYKTIIEGFSRSGRLAEDYQFAEQRDEFPKGLQIILSEMKILDLGLEVVYGMVDKGIMKLATANAVIRQLRDAGKCDEAEKLARILVKAGGISPGIVRAGVADRS